jgi:L-threonylcarbamoyladenylate synthase
VREEIARAVEVVRAGGVVGLPTDTVYGIGVDPLEEAAVATLFELKGRPADRPMGLLVASLEEAAEIGLIEGAALDLARSHWPGALTLVVRPRVVLAEWVGDRQANTVGIRVPDHPVALELLQAAGPMSVTSANRSGYPEARNDTEARAIFGDRVHYVAGSSPGGDPSTVVDVTGGRPVVLRQGPVVVAR